MRYTNPSEMHDTFAAAFATADPDNLVVLYEPDAVQVGPDGQLITGHEQLRVAFEDLLNAGISLDGTQEKAIMAGDVALTSSRYEVEVTGEDGEPRTVTVHTAEVSRRQSDGTWRVVIDAPGFA